MTRAHRIQGLHLDGYLFTEDVQYGVYYEDTGVVYVGYDQDVAEHLVAKDRIFQPESDSYVVRVQVERIN